MGLMLAEPGYHTRALIEWEDWPRAVLIAAQRAGYLAAAPIWDDLRSFDARPFRGAFDTVLAGYRARALRLLGNGVHPLAAAHAWRTLAAAHGLGPVDLAAVGWAGRPGAPKFDS